MSTLKIVSYLFILSIDGIDRILSYDDFYSELDALCVTDDERDQALAEVIETGSFELMYADTNFSFWLYPMKQIIQTEDISLLLAEDFEDDK